MKLNSAVYHSQGQTLGGGGGHLTDLWEQQQQEEEARGGGASEAASNVLQFRGAAGDVRAPGVLAVWGTAPKAAEFTTFTIKAYVPI